MEAAWKLKVRKADLQRLQLHSPPKLNPEYSRLRLYEYLNVLKLIQMRKLKLQIQLSVDGFISGPNGEMDWMIWNWDDKLQRFVNEVTEPVETIILGRKLAQGFIPHWTDTYKKSDKKDEFAKKMVETDKIVFTKTLDKSEWKSTELSKGGLKSEIEKLKKADGKDIIVYGGGQFVSSLIKENLIDEFYFFINPSILGSGMAIFEKVEYKKDLKLEDAKTFECGITVLKYNA
jgi:dihydrofolate reductase